MTAIPRVDQLAEIRRRGLDKWWEENQDALVRRILESVYSEEYKFPVWRPGWNKFGREDVLDTIETRLNERFKVADPRYSIEIDKDRSLSNPQFIWVMVEIKE